MYGEYAGCVECKNWTDWNWKEWEGNNGYCNLAKTQTFPDCWCKHFVSANQDERHCDATKI